MMGPPISGLPVGFATLRAILWPGTDAELVPAE